ncbi:MAG: Gfo/Idh/MocA family oxidoreductase [Myxococcota bacterium]
MRQLIQSYRTGEMKVENVPPPQVRPGGILVRTVRSLVSAGTEKMIVDIARKSLIGKARARPDLVRKTLDAARKQGVINTLQKVRSKLDTPIPLGYSSAGVVVEVGDQVTEFRVGDRVACGGAGYANHAEYNYVPRNLAAKIPDGLSMDDACSATVGAIALQSVRQVEPTLGERVAVLGLGLIGQICVQLLRANGCRVLGFDPDPDRAKLALELGAHEAVSSNVEQAADRFSRGQGVDAVVVAASTPSAGPLEQAGEISRLHGRVVVVGLVGMEVPRSLYYRKELDLRMSMSYGPGRYDPDFEERGFDYPIAHVRWTEQRNIQAILDLAADGQLKVGPLITHHYPIDEALDAYQLISEGKQPFLGILLEYGADDEKDILPERRIDLSSEPLRTDKLGVGLLGAGGFGQSVLLPALRHVGGTENVVIASAGGMTAQRIAEQYGFRSATSDSEDVIGHPGVDAVFILTRHNLHAPMIVEALKAGKHVFCEKPMALSHEELDDVIAARQESEGDVMIGFNRRFAPLVKRIEDHFAGRTHPLMMNYRVNAGFIPHDHWVHDPVEGGGRILGEACHFIDLLQHLAGSPPVRVSADSIAGDTRYRGDDNVSITLTFADGSVGTVMYTAMGSSRLSKEYLEVMGEGKSAILDDFRTLDLYDGGRHKGHKASNQDKGFNTEMKLFVEAVRERSEMPIPFQESIASTRATLEVIDSLATGAERPMVSAPLEARRPAHERSDTRPDATEGRPFQKLQPVYDRLPVPLQNMVVSAAGLRSYRSRVGEPFQETLDELKDRDLASADEVRADQDARLRDIVKWSAETVPYYRRLFTKEGIDPDSIRGLDDLDRIPPLDKETVRIVGTELKSDAIPDRQIIPSHTSGTTGKALALYLTREALAWKHAVTMRQRSWFGIELGQRYAVFGGQMVVPFAQTKPPFWRYDRARNLTLFSLYHMKPEFLRYYAEELSKPGYTFWQGYPSSISLLCEYLVEARYELGSAAPRAVFTSSETLLEFQRERIEKATGAPIADLYANAELSVSVVQSPEARYHVDTEFCAVEIDAHDETDEWARGEVISTGFANRAMPFLRYRTGDVATLLKKPNVDSKRSRPVLERIDGRIEDYVVTPDGRRIGRMDHIFKDTLDIKEAQIVQSSLDRLLVRLVPRATFDEGSRRYLDRAFRKRLGSAIDIEYELTESIPREANGKFRAVISEVETGKIR